MSNAMRSKLIVVTPGLADARYIDRRRSALPTAGMVMVTFARQRSHERSRERPCRADGFRRSGSTSTMSTRATSTGCWRAHQISPPIPSAASSAMSGTDQPVLRRSLTAVRARLVRRAELPAS